jgi:hypothetical protein
MSAKTTNGLARRQAAPTPIQDVIPIPIRPSEAGSDPPEPDDAQSVLIWDEEGQAADNYQALAVVYRVSGLSVRK